MDVTWSCGGGAMSHGKSPARMGAGAAAGAPPSPCFRFVPRLDDLGLGAAPMLDAGESACRRELARMESRAHSDRRGRRDGEERLPGGEADVVRLPLGVHVRVHACVRRRAELVERDLVRESRRRCRHGAARQGVSRWAAAKRERASTSAR